MAIPIQEPSVPSPAEPTAPRARRRLRFDPVWLTFVVLLVLWLYSLARVEGFRTVDYNLFTLRVAAFLGIVAAGQTLVVLMGGIDLSVAAVVTMAGVVGGSLIATVGEAPAIGLTLLLAALVGGINGLGVVVLRLPPLVMTLASLSVIQGALLVYNAGKPVSGVSAFLNFWALGFLLRIPTPVWALALVSLVCVVLLQRTAYGRAVYAIGNNPRAAFLSGVPTGTVQVATYALSGLFAGVAGLLILGRTGYSSKTAGDPFLLMSIAAVVVGGTSILGGRGKFIGTIGGALLLTVLVNVLTVENIPEAGRMIVQGVLILALLVAYASAEE
ncbi:MAG TPA: ABC transporter permease [Thermomicrobiales bacterium]|nr:ABC transporter permease [Thermomicrobiales bacterium]